MSNALGLLLAIMSKQFLVAAFSQTPTRVSWRRVDVDSSCRQLHNTRLDATSLAEEKVQINTEVPVLHISVCAGELCQCQGEQFEYTGGASDAAIAELLSLGLPFPIDDVGCLGVCGMGTMIAIDYENGDSIMTDGLDSTLLELGIIKTQNEQPSSSISEQTENKPIEECVAATIEAVFDDDNEEAAAATSISMVPTTTQNDTKEKPESTKPPLLADARDRMRQEASVEVQNPWMNMASYLAKKATDKVFGGEE